MDAPMRVRAAAVRYWVLAALFFLGAAALFFAPVLLEDRTFAFRDNLAQNYPQRVLVAELVRRGEFPFWNPYHFGGMPLLAAWQTGVFFPGNWGFWVLPPTIALNLTVVAAYALAGLTTFGLARALRLPMLAAALAGLVFMFSGFMVAHLDHINMVQAAALVPALLWVAERWASTSQARYALIGAWVTALLVFAGHPNMMLVGLLVLGAYGAFRAFSTARPAHYLGGLSLSTGLGLALSLPQLLPTLEFAARTQRQHMGYKVLVSDSLDPLEAMTFLFPFAFGGKASFAVPYWGSAPWQHEVVGYVGVGTLVLAAIALTRGGRAWFWGALAAVALVLALGSYTSLYRLIADWPVFSHMRAPARHLMEIDLALAILAGYGLAGLTDAGKARWRAVMGVGAAIGLVMAGATVAGGPALAQGVSPKAVSGALPVIFWLLTAASVALAACRTRWLPAVAAVVLLDLVVFGQNLDWRTSSPPASAVDRRLEGRLSADRHYSVAAENFPYADLAALAALHYHGPGLLTGERSAAGYDAFLVARHQRLLAMMDSAGAKAHNNLWSIGHHTLDVLAVRTVYRESRLSWREIMPEARWRGIGQEGRVNTFENRRALPMVWRPERASVLPPERVDRRMTQDPAFRPAEEALVETPLASPLLTPGRAELVRRTAGTLDIETEGSGPGLVVVSESFDPGWRAYRGDTELPVYRVDGLVLGVAVPAGSQRFQLRYVPATWPLGLAGAGAALTGWIAWAGLAWRKRRPASAGAPAMAARAPVARA